MPINLITDLGIEKQRTQLFEKIVIRDTTSSPQLCSAVHPLELAGTRWNCLKLALGCPGFNIWKTFLSIKPNSIAEQASQYHLLHVLVILFLIFTLKCGRSHLYIFVLFCIISVILKDCHLLPKDQIWKWI